MTQEEQPGPPLRVGFAIPASELERARASFGGVPKGADPYEFDRVHLRGWVKIAVAAPFAADPVLDKLRRDRVVDLRPPVKVELEQPVAYVIGQLANALVLARHGEGEFTIPLAGGRGAITVGCEGDTVHLGVPLESYAGVAEVPAAAAAAAIAAACRALVGMLEQPQALSTAGIARFLAREAAILESDARASDKHAPPREARRWEAGAAAEGAGATLPNAAVEAEKRGAHVVPYWNAEAAGEARTLSFAPLRAPGRGDRAGALALCIFPDGERLLEAALAADPEGESKLRARLRRRAPFSAVFSGGCLVRLVEATSELPMA